ERRVFLGHVLGEIEKLTSRFLAPIHAMRGRLDLLGVIAVAEILAPRFLEFSIRAKHGDARTGRARRNIDAVLRIDHDAAAEAPAHARGKLAPAFIKRVSPLAFADLHRCGIFGGGKTGSSEGGSGSGAHFQKVTAAKTTGE